MPLSIYTNLAALNAHRNLEVNSNSMNQSIERLSSGLRINSAADNPAGFVISNHLGTQVAGLNQATQNTTDAVNIIKTASSALGEIQQQLQNIRDLTLDAANSNGNVQQRAADQAQVDQALTSINRIADQTNFDGMSLLGGTNGTQTLDGIFFQIGANATEKAQFSLQGLTFGMKSDGVTPLTMTANMHSTALGFNAGASATYATATSSVAATAMVATSNENYQVSWTHPDGTTTNAIFHVSGVQADATAIAASINTALSGVAYSTAKDATVNNLGQVLQATVVNGSVQIGVQNVLGTTGEATNASSLTVQSSSNDGTGANFGLGGITAKGSLAGSGIDLMSPTTMTQFDAIINSIDDALNMVNGLSVNLGAFQNNNLQSDLNSLSVAIQNTNSSQSSIKDTDMAAEMVNFTKSQILAQAAQAMMTQANQAPQNILTMLRGQA